jgi:RIO-like serine/threonine protein kinase
MYRIFFKDFYVQFVDDEEESWEDYLEKDCPVLYRAYRRVNDKKNRAGEELKRLIMSYLPDKTEGYILFAWHTIVDSSTPSLNKRYEKILSKYTSIFNNAPAVKEMKELIKEMEEFMETDW